MRASRDELRSVFKQAFEACAYDFGRYENAADLVVWAQMHGLDVFAFVEECLIPLEQGSLSATLLQDDPCRLVFDGQGNSVLVHASQIVNLASAKALDSTFCEVQVQNCRHPVLLSKLFSDIKHLGLYTRALWYDAQRTKALVLNADPMHDCPALSYYSNFEGLNQHALEFVVAKDPDALTAIDSIFADMQADDKLSSDDLAQCYQQSLNQGIEIDGQLWQRLIDMGAAVLVESSEQSRQGAGS